MSFATAYANSRYAEMGELTNWSVDYNTYDFDNAFDEYVSLRNLTDDEQNELVDALLIQLSNDPHNVRPNWYRTALFLHNHTGVLNGFYHCRVPLQRLRRDVVLYICSIEDVRRAWLVDIGPASLLNDWEQDVTSTGFNFPDHTLYT